MEDGHFVYHTMNSFRNGRPLQGFAFFVVHTLLDEKRAGSGYVPLFGGKNVGIHKDHLHVCCCWHGSSVCSLSSCYLAMMRCNKALCNLEFVYIRSSQSGNSMQEELQTVVMLPHELHP